MNSFNLEFIDLDEFKYLLKAKNVSKADRYRLAQYPYVSLCTLYKDLTNKENVKCKKIEDQNIFEFLRTVSLLFGVGSRKDVNTINSFMQEEPLLSAVIAARQESDPQMRFPKYIETACKIILSTGKEGTNMQNLINLRLNGKMPQRLFTFMQRKGDQWFNNFVCIKLEALKSAYKYLGKDATYPFFLSSIAYSLYYFSPYRYNITNCKDEDEALHIVLKTFNNIV